MITNLNTGQVVGNYSLVYTQLNANTIAGSLPSTFNATQSLGVGNYSAVITYYPTANFAQPAPLTVQFSITVCYLAQCCPGVCSVHGWDLCALQHHALCMADVRCKLPVPTSCTV